MHVRDGVVAMEGTVNDHRSKYGIEDIALSVFGVRDVLNHIRVHRFGVLASEWAGPKLAHVDRRDVAIG